MRILFIAPFPFFHDRGAAYRIRSIATAAAGLGHKLDIVTYHVGRDVHIDGVKIYRIRNLPFKPYAVGISFGRIITDFFVLKKALEVARKQEYDCIQAEDSNGAIIGSIVKGVIKKPMIYDVHGLFSSIMERYAENQLIGGGFSKALIKLFRTAPLKKFLKIAEKHLYRNSDILLLNWKSFLPKIREINKKIPCFVIEDTIPSLFEKNVPKTDIARIRLKYRIKKGEILLLYTGNFLPYQGVDVLIKSFHITQKKFPKTVLMLVGNSAEEKYGKLVRELGLGKKVIFTGQKPMEEMPAFLASADILLSALNYKYENATVKIITYLIQNKPIVASNIPAYTQILNEDMVFLASPNPTDFSYNIERVLTEPKEAKRRAFNAYKYAKNNFSFQELQRRLQGVYRQLE